MTQTVIAVFDNPDSALAAGETLLSQGLDQSSFHIAVGAETEDSPLHSTESIDDIRIYLSNLFGSDEAESYMDEVERGGILFSVELSDEADLESVRDTLLEAGAFDVNEHQDQAMSSQEQSSDVEGTTIPMVEEEMEVGKSRMETGNVRVSSRLEETPVQEDVNLQEERARIEKRPLDQPIDPSDIESLGERSLEVQETAEKPVVNKSARIVGEVEVGKETGEKTQSVQDTVRRTEVDVERTPGKGKGKGQS